MLLQQDKLSLSGLPALQASKILHFCRLYTFLHHYKVTLQALQGNTTLDFKGAYMLSHDSKISSEPLES